MAKPRPENSARPPSVDVVLRDAAFAELLTRFGHQVVRDAIRLELAEIRQNVGAVDTAPGAILQAVRARVSRRMAPSLKPVFNLTGTILHTNLGRAPLPDVAVQAMVAAAGAVNLEYDLKTGKRGSRDSHLAGWVQQLTGAEAAIVVNNNAAAVMMMLNTFALGKEVIVSRGELIEIGGAFRLPDIMTRAGCILREVGTTNRTHLKDYQAAVNPLSGMILKVHTSNYQVQGFTKSVPEPELAALARKHNIPFAVDLGSGTLLDLTRFGLPYETTVRETLENGADLVSFSGDKLLGGPQAGIIAGRADLIAQIAENPMKRAMRLDKITIAALDAVLRLYANPDQLASQVPTLTALSRSSEDIKALAGRLQPLLAEALAGQAVVEVLSCHSQIGSGALPVDLLESYALGLRPIGEGDKALRRLAAALRDLPCPVIGRISNGQVILDLRALSDEPAFSVQLGQVAACLRAAR